MDKVRAIGRRIAKAGICALLPLLAASGAASAQAKLTPADYVEIYNLYSAYSIALDTGNGAGRIATFTPDGTFSWIESKHQPESMAVLKARTDKYPQKKIPEGMMHILTNIQILPTADGADGSCYAALMGPPPKGSTDYFWMPAYYEDKLVKTPAGWRFKSREVFMASEAQKK